MRLYRASYEGRVAVRVDEIRWRRRRRLVDEDSRAYATVPSGARSPSTRPPPSPLLTANESPACGPPVSGRDDATFHGPSAGFFFFFLLENNVSAEGDIRHTFSPRWPSPVDSSYFLGAAVFGPSLFVVFLFSILSYFLGQWKGQTHLHCHMSLVKSLATSELTRSPQRYAKCTKYV